LYIILVFVRPPPFYYLLRVVEKIQGMKLG
jgi:hypothetical protein